MPLNQFLEYFARLHIAAGLPPTLSHTNPRLCVAARAASNGFARVSKLKERSRPADIDRACPGARRERIRSLVADLKAAGEAACRVKGPVARWEYLGCKDSIQYLCAFQRMVKQAIPVKKTIAK